VIFKFEGEPAMREEQKGEIILYQAEDQTTKIEVRLENENVWLNQKKMAELFQTTPQNITIHLKNVFDEGEDIGLYDTVINPEDYKSSFENVAEN
jgi:hypothetical protein